MATEKAGIRMFYHHAEWVLNHPRFGMLMIALILLSFLNYAWLAAVLFVVFAFEISLRAAVIRYKLQTYPYKSSTHHRLDILFLVLDIVGVLSLLVTVFQFALPLDDAAVVRLLRAVYLLRALRLFRYFDLQSAIYSPTYGMVISLMVLFSFFVSGVALWAVLLFFIVELIVRRVVMRNMLFSSQRNKAIEWAFWWVDLVATIAMIPGLTTLQFGNWMRALRLVRLFRPWLVILRNLRQVIKEGQFFQEINLIVLLLAVLSFAGGVWGNLVNDHFDFTQDGAVTEKDSEMLAQTWFAFRAFTDPGNVVAYPETNEIAIFSVFAVIVGVFVFAFFIGIGANIVSGLMSRLRNEKMNIANHMVMLGWNEASPFILSELRAMSHRSFTRMKLVLLNDREERPQGFLKENWVSYRWGDIENPEDLQRVNMGAARQAIVSVPDSSNKESHSHSFFSLLAIRDENPDIYISYAYPGFVKPRVKTHKHPLHVGWDQHSYYDKPTVIHSQVDVRANLFRQVLQYRDFDQVMTRLMVPPRVDEPALHAVEWFGELVWQEGVYLLQYSDGSCKIEVEILVRELFRRGVILVAIASPSMQIQAAMVPTEPMQVFTLVGIARDANTLFGEIEFVMHNIRQISCESTEPVTARLLPLESKSRIRIVIIGWVGALPLMLKRLLQSYEAIAVTVIDDLSAEERDNQQLYLDRRIEEMPGASERVSFELVGWDYTDMDDVTAHISGADRVILSRPMHVKVRPYAFVASILSDLMVVLQAIDEHPMIFPVMDTRDQALVLQKQMEKFKVEREIHLLVPNEFYGTYVAHTSYHMFISGEKHVYEMHRALRYVLDDMMRNDSQEDSNMFVLDALKVDGALPENAPALFSWMLSQGYLWIGYRMRSGVDISAFDNSLLYKVFPREIDYRCLRQHSIIINPLALPQSIQLWEQKRTDIVELIVVRFGNSVRQKSTGSDQGK